VKEIKGFR